ncbi:FAD/NAD(P)-binding domain-containing protein [Coprinopsis marcescibilis]|uniref:FAD/NAD(P)-binding domain-containing protein n=1 Tax=Coprinopsis marcescibilis TaxID=230819 RepID=A0A5C3KE94_COPMA|nr:FAD/NAD(P)-binding domain-containing protein [Coprinopsis marcescibilis]
MSHTDPAHSKVLIIGGGPGGAYAASVLAREGIQVTVLEATKFPRYHIGESMLPSLKLFLRFIGAEDKVKKHGFCVKPGAAVKLNQFKREGYTDFVRHDPDNGSWNVTRSEFDDILLSHAEECGASVLQEHKVTQIEFSSDENGQPTSRPCAATFTCPSGEGRITFDYLIDASGRNGIMSTKYLHNRRMNQTLKNIACWGYWSGQLKMYKPGTGRENAPWFEALTDESGWAWFIPLANGVVSVGVVMDQVISTKKKSDARAANQEASLKDHYLEQLFLAPGIKDLLGAGTLVGDVKSASDYSYSPDRYSGDHYRLVGDAGAFIDPFFSSGVHLAILSGLTASITISASLNGHCTEDIASDFYNIKSSTAYTRFLVVVLSVYKQIRSQQSNYLCDVDEDNFDRAFDMLRPIIQGTADVGKKLTEDELRQTLDFCKDVFAATDNDMVESVASRFSPELLSIAAPIFSADQLKRLVDPSDKDAVTVINRVNAVKALGPLYVTGPSSIENEPVNGYIACIEQGQLGLIKID